MSELSPEVQQEISRRFPPDRFSIRTADRLNYSRDMWPRGLLRIQAREPLIAPPQAIVWPTSVNDVKAIVELANQRRVPLIAWGAGSGVCGATQAVREGIAVDLKQMNEPREIVANDGIASFGAGILGQHLEEHLNLYGLTLGHFPSSLSCSTLGGWIATRSSGQCSTYYGNIEDLVDGIEVVTGKGECLQLDRHGHPDLTEAFLGSEGTLGIITGARLRVRAKPAAHAYNAYLFRDVPTGCRAMQRIMQRGLKPAVMRLYDPFDSWLFKQSGRRQLRAASRSFLPELRRIHRDSSSPLQTRLIRAALTAGGIGHWAANQLIRWRDRGCILVVGHQGEQECVDASVSVTESDVIDVGGSVLGPALGEHWLKTRYDTAFKQSAIFAAGAFVDTMEVATTWDRLDELYRTVRAALSEKAVVMAHFSHAYITGCSIYFTFAAAASTLERSQALYDELWYHGVAAAHRLGATMSHHHGVGLGRARFMREEHGDWLHLLAQLKRMFDPQMILNPGKLGL